MTRERGRGPDGGDAGCGSSTYTGCSWQNLFMTNLTASGRRRALSVSVVPRYAEAIMDGDSDGFPGMSSSEIASDTEAAALAEQFSLTVRRSCHSHILCAIGVLLRGRVSSGSTRVASGLTCHACGCA